MRLLYEDTFGEWMLGALLERAGAANANALAAEWQDDRIVFFEPKETLGEGPLAVGFVWRIRVTSPAAANASQRRSRRLYERPDGRNAANVAAADDRVEVVRGRMAAPSAMDRTLSSPRATSTPPEGR